MVQPKPRKNKFAKISLIEVDGSNLVATDTTEKNRKTKQKILIFENTNYALADMRRKARITLPNGLKLVIYPKKHPKTTKFFERCSKIEMQTWLHPPFGEGCWNDYCLIKIRVGHTTLHALIELYPPIPKYVRNKLREKGFDAIVTSIVYIEHGGTLYQWSSDRGQYLIEATRRGVEPEVYPLLIGGSTLQNKPEKSNQTH